MERARAKLHVVTKDRRALSRISPQDYNSMYEDEAALRWNNLNYAMSSTQEEEIESLRAIFCRDDEFITEKDTEGQLITVNFDLSSLADNEVKRNSTNGSIRISLAPGYPQTQQPKIYIRCSCLPSSVRETVQQKVEETAAALQGQSMLLDLCYLAQELLEREIKTLLSTRHKADGMGMASQTKVPGIIQRHLKEQKHCNTASEVSTIVPDYGLQIMNSESDLECSKYISSRTRQLKDLKFLHNNKFHNSKDQDFSGVENDSKVMTALLQLDHMRSQQSYIKSIKKWTAEQGLTGRLIFCNKLILILLQGTTEAIREYIVTNRTTNVDVDSKGRACKERMLTVVCEVPVDSHERLSDFCVLELPAVKSLQELFDSLSMQDLYGNYVSHLSHIQGSRITSSKQHK